MRVEKVSSVPLVLHDPFFNIWSSFDHLNDGNTTHWSGKPSHVKGFVQVGEKTYCFLGESGVVSKIPQVSLDIRATRTTCGFANEEIAFSVTFLSPLLLDDLPLASRPLSFLQVKTAKMPKESVRYLFQVDETMVCHDGDGIDGYVTEKEGICYGRMGKASQSPLSESGDKTTVNWGWCYLAGRKEDSDIQFAKQSKILSIKLTPDKKGQAFCALAYDQEYVIDYFGMLLHGYWHKKWPNMETAISSAFKNYKNTERKCTALDEKLERDALACISDDYALLCVMSYRLAIAAHQVALGPEGQLLCFSKENSSNGCIATVDVSYPSVPLFLLQGTECIKGMLEPIFKFAQRSVWNKGYAPHDVGRFPYATGQVYGLNDHSFRDRTDFQTMVYPPFAEYPASAEVYDDGMQMPVEECGNMLLMCAALVLKEQSADFLKGNISLLHLWTDYLVEHGLDPGNQLCTDDFAGHLAHNANLSIKAILGIEAFSLIRKYGNDVEESNEYHEIALRYAKEWERLSNGKTHTVLNYGQEASWSLKYNMIWDYLFPRQLFSDAVKQEDASWYASQCNEYGIPLDSRKDYTKSDWTLWIVAMLKDESQRKDIVARVAHYIKDSETRIPFSDWYDTKSGDFVSFIARSVQGGIFMPLLMKKGL